MQEKTLSTKAFFLIIILTFLYYYLYYHQKGMVAYMKNPIILMIIGLFVNIFSFLFLDRKLFLISFLLYMSVIIVYILFSPYRADLFLFVVSNIFFAGFNYYITKIWNFIQMDDSCQRPWIPIFFKFKKLFLQFVTLLIAIYAIISIIYGTNTAIVKSIFIIAVVTLAPIVLLIVNNLLTIIFSGFFIACKLNYDDIKI